MAACECATLWICTRCFVQPTASRWRIIANCSSDRARVGKSALREEVRLSSRDGGESLAAVVVVVVALWAGFGSSPSSEEEEELSGR